MTTFLAGFAAISSGYMVVEGAHVWRQVAWGIVVLAYSLVSFELLKERGTGK